MAESVLIREINTDALNQVVDDKEIFDISLLFSNVGHQSYRQELLLLLDLVNPPEFCEEECFHLFGVLMDEKYTGQDDPMRCYLKELVKPMNKRNFHICGFFHFYRNISYIVFEDGVVWTFNNENNAGIVHKCKLKMPFEKVCVCFFEPWQKLLMLQSDKLERVFY